MLLQIQLPDDPRPIELVGRACWTRVEFEPGETGARPVCLVGIEVMGGAPRAIERYERTLSALEGLECPEETPVARPPGVG